jgi:hypothetical protein
MRSRVVCALAVTIETSLPTMELVSVLLPAFGMPIKATFTAFESLFLKKDFPW